jgi:MtrB/PioB family decaheme-associated outer membrane protein
MSIINPSSPRVVFCLLGILPLSLFAEQASQSPPTQDAVPSVNQLELGIGYVSDDAYHFGRYSGLIEQGPYVIGNVKAKEYRDTGGFWRLRGTNLGLDSRYLRLETGIQGEQDYYIEYDQLPDYENDTASTPFLLPGDTTLVLPADFSMANVKSFLLPFDQETERKRLGIGARFFFKRRWELETSMQRETKRGTDWIGGAMGPLDPERLMFKTTVALLPEPIDYETNDIDVTLRYQGNQTHLQFAYQGSMFSNHDASLSWQDPFDLSRTGRISLEPDNQMHQLSAILGQVLSPTSRLTALVSLAQLTQDESFLPYNTRETTDTLPRNSLDGEVWVLRGKLKLTTRPQPRLRLGAQYSYDERDNRTDVEDYFFYIADGRIGLKDVLPRYNDPLSYRRHRLDLSANYHINPKMSLRGGYEYTHMRRDSIDQERKTTREHSLTAKWKYTATPAWQLALYGEASKRSGSDYQTRPFENPALRTYYLADLDRYKLGASVHYLPIDRLTLGLTAEYLNDNYTKSVLGLTDAEQGSLLLDANYLITERITSHAFYSREDFASKVAGAQDGTITVPDWHGGIQDSIDTFGLGIEFMELFDKWDAGADLVYTRSRGELNMGNSITSITNPDSIAELDPLQPFPDLKNKLMSLQLWARYQYSEKISYKFSYWYEDYRGEDWAIDGTLVDLQADTVENMLWLDEGRLDYTQHVIGASVIMKF